MTEIRTLGEFLNLEIAKGYSRIARYPLLVWIKDGNKAKDILAISRSWPEAEMVLEQHFPKLAAGQLVVLTEVNI